MDQREFISESPELNQIIASIPFQEIYQKIEVLEPSLKKIEEAYKDKKEIRELVHLGVESFDVNYETANFIKERLEDLFNWVQKDPRHKLWAEITNLKTALSQFKFNEVRSILEKIEAKLSPSEKWELKEKE